MCALMESSWIALKVGKGKGPPSNFEGGPFSITRGKRGIRLARRSTSVMMMGFGSYYGGQLGYV